MLKKEPPYGGPFHSRLHQCRRIMAFCDNRWQRIGTTSALKFGFLISCYQIFAFGRMPRICKTFHKRLLADGRMDTFAMVADSKVFIVARNKHVVPAERRVERLPSGHSVRESRDDSQGSYWYVVTALEVVRPRNA